jgi:hypothetical protein
MAIIGRCFKIFFGHEPPTGRPPDPGGPGGGCDPNCGGGCGSNCGGADRYTCVDPETDYCVLSNFGETQAVCDAACNPADPTCVCRITSFSTENSYTGGPQGTAKYVQTKIITIVQECKLSDTTVTYTLAGISASEFLDDTTGDWGGWTVGTNGTAGGACGTNDACAGGNCSDIILTGTRESEDDTPHPCPYHTCVEDNEGFKDCEAKSADAVDQAHCDHQIAANTAWYSSDALCSPFCINGPPPCYGYNCEDDTGVGSEPCEAKKKCTEYTLDLTGTQTCAEARAAHAPVLSDDSTCGGAAQCCTEPNCWWTCGGTGGTDEECVECTKTDNTACGAPPSVSYWTQESCQTSESNCEDCIDYYSCSSTSNISGDYCQKHSKPDGSLLAGEYANSSDCTGTCYEGFDCMTDDTCPAATDFGAAYLLHETCLANCGSLTWICPSTPVNNECTQEGAATGGDGTYTSKALCEKAPGDCMHSWVCSETTEKCTRQVGAGGQATKAECISLGGFDADGNPGPCSPPPTDPGGETGTGDPTGPNLPPPNTESTGSGDSDVRVTREVITNYQNYLEEIKFPNKDSTISDPYVSNIEYKLQDKFVPITNGKKVRLDIFSNVIHASLNYIFNLTVNNLYRVNETAFDDITIENIYLSLNKITKRVVDNAYDSLGQPLKDKILVRLRYLILTEQVDKFDLQGLSELTNKKKDVIFKTLGNERRALNEISTKGKSLSYKSYGGINREHMKMWKTLAPDLDKAIPIVLADSTVTYIDINMDDSYTFTLSGGGTETRYINDGDYITFVTPTGELSYLELYSDIDKAKMLDIEDTTRIHKLLGDDHFFKFSVSSDETELVEETYSLSTPHPEKYILKLDPSTVEDLPRDKPIIRKSKATYSVITDEEEISSWISTKPWPYLKKYVDHQDPFLNHLESSNTMSVEFKDVSFDQFLGYEDQFPVLPRRIPWYIVVIPTDKTMHLLGGNMSFLTGFASRELTFGYSSFTKETSQKWDPYLFGVSHGNRGDGILPFDENDFPISLTYSPSRFSIYEFPYKKGTEKLPRKASPVKNLLTAISTTKDLGVDYVDGADTIMPWGAIFKKIPVMSKKELFMIEGIKWPDLKSKIESNTFAKDPTVQSRYVKLSESPFLGITSAEGFVTPPKKTRPTKVDIDPPAPTPGEL